jgi:hypothetical protein
MVETTMMRGTQRATIGDRETRGGGLADVAARIQSLTRQLDAAPAGEQAALRRQLRELAATLTLLAKDA